MKCKRCSASLEKGKFRCAECGLWNPHDTKDITSLPTLDKITPSNDKRIDVGPYNLLWGTGISRTCVTMLAGPPGIGKSTFALHLLDYMARRQERESLYFTAGEMDPSMLKDYADRIRIKRQHKIRPVPILSGEHSIPDLITRFNPYAVIFDSLQGFIKRDYDAGLKLLEGLHSVAVELECPMIVVSHINKGGDAEGLEAFKHAVDVMLYFEIEETEDRKICTLEVEKSRVGPAGVSLPLEMRARGLMPVELDEEDLT